jgi:ParB-like chromosome segregation protein Spo0J
MQYGTSVVMFVSDFDCRDVNAVENLQRKDLTLYQEARSIKHYWLADWPRDEIATRVSKSPGWVQVRCMLLEMEPEIQQAADQGYLLQSDIRELYKYKGTERLKRAGLVRDARKSGQTKNIVDKIKKKAKASSKKRRTEYEIQELMEYIRIHFERVDPEETMILSDFISPQGNSIIHRVMAWVSGTITSLDVHMSLRDFCRKMGIEYTLPEFEPEKL